MSVKRYGIYLAFPPTVDLRAEGLGRQLALFLKGAQSLSGVHFTVVCPSWTTRSLDELFCSEQVPMEGITVLAPNGKPYVLRLFEWIRAYRARPRRNRWFLRQTESVLRGARRLWSRLMGRAMALHNLRSLLGFAVEVILWSLLAVPALLALSPIVLILLGARGGVLLARRLGRIASGVSVHLGAMSDMATRTLSAPEKQNWVLSLFEAMQAQEVRRMHALVAKLSEVSAWYCPTAFWPSFHDIKAPRLMCVPDVVLTDFPAGFALVGGDLFLQTFETLGRAIRSGDHFVTYSEHVKWHTLVDQYGVPAHNVISVPHAPNTLNQLVDVRGTANPEETSRQYCRMRLRLALARSTNVAYTATFENDEVKFLFYASQFRPNKNVITLLRAYEYLLRKRYKGHKLILTGNPEVLPQIGRFVREHRLENDVIFLHGLSVSELAACYKLADLAVNPTFSEGGCPFTFTEALSVGTPVVMSDIPVAREVLTDTALQEATFFDPYDWRDCASRIEWALDHLDELFAIQEPVFRKLNERTWADVATEHIVRLEEIALQRVQGGVA